VQLTLHVSIPTNLSRRPFLPSAASSSVVAFLIQNVAIAHPKDGMVVASLFLFAVGISVAANAVGNLIGQLDLTAQQQTDLHVGQHHPDTKAHEGFFEGIKKAKCPRSR
jgi:hypothetical protein